MHDKRCVWFLLFLGICIVNCKNVSYSHINANFIGSAKSQKNGTLIEVDDSNLNKKRNYDQDQHEIRNNQLEIYGEASMTALAKSRSSREREKKKKTDMFTRLLPMFIIPYLIQSAILPMMLMSLKTMLIKSFFIGKLAVILGIFNMLRTRNNSEYQEVENDDANGSSGSYGHYGMYERENEKQANDLLKQHYGYNGNEEFGAWFHHRSYKH